MMKNIENVESRKILWFYRLVIHFIVYIAIFTAVVVLYIEKPWPVSPYAMDLTAKYLGDKNKSVHAIVIDAGSTGSRIFAFTFHRASSDGHLVLDKELYVQSEPGLSAFALNPKKALDTITTLLKSVETEIPKQYWSKTPLVLKATAGLRLIPEQAQNLLDIIREYVMTTPFLTNNNSVSILDAKDEGIFSWFTVNFLLDRFSNSTTLDNPAKSVAAFDLGGGSMQVTFSVLKPPTLQHWKHVFNTTSPNGDIQVYTKSSLGLGLMAGRKAVITFNNTGPNITSECLSSAIHDHKFSFGEETFFVSGAKRNEERIGEKEIKNKEHQTIMFPYCLNIISKYIKARVFGKHYQKERVPEELQSKQIYAFSYYFDKAAEVGLIDGLKGGQVKVEDFRLAAERVCEEVNVQRPFICLDLTFIWVLLREGLGLRPDTKIFLVRKIAGHEISWALGQAYRLVRQLP